MTLSPAARQRVIAAMLVSTFMSAAEVTVISTAMPTIVSRLGGFALFTWAFGIYLLGQAAMTPIYGRLADLLGRRTTYLCSTGLFLLGSLLCGFAWSMPALIVFRAIQGLGGGGLVPLATTVICDVSEPAQRARQMGYVSGIWGVAGIAGPLIGSLCVQTIGWPWVFWLNIPIGLLSMAMFAGSFRDQPHERDRGGLDLAGSALLAGGVGCGMALMVQGPTLGIDWLVALSAACAVLILLFALRERQATLPMLALHLLRRRVILAGNVSALLTGALVIETTAFIPPMVQGVLGRDALISGLVLGVLTVSWTAVSLGLGRVLVRLPGRVIALVSAVLMIGGSALLALPPNLALMLAGCIPLGAGLGANSLVFTVAIQNAVTTGDRGRATSLFYFCRLLGQAVGAAALGGVLNAGLAQGGPDMREALQDLVGLAHRARLSPEMLAQLVPVLSGALLDVFACGVAIAAASVFVAMLVPRHRHETLKEDAATRV